MDLSSLALSSGLAHAEEPRAEEPRAQDPAAEKEADQTRRLESQIEEYPVTEPVPKSTPNAPVPPTVIPEVIEPPQRPRSAPKVAPSAAPRAPELEPVAGRLQLQPIDLAALDARQVVQLQQRLRGRGYYLGPIDGIVGSKTRAALAAFAADQYALSRRLLADGQLTPELAPLVSASASAPKPPAGSAPGEPGSPPSP